MIHAQLVNNNNNNSAEVQCRAFYTIRLLDDYSHDGTPEVSSSIHSVIEIYWACVPAYVGTWMIIPTATST